MNQDFLNQLIKADALIEGESAILELVKAEPDNLQALELLALIRVNLAKYDLALADFKKLSKFLPDSASVWSNIGNIYYEKDLHSKAVEYYEKALKLDQFDSAIYSNASNSYAQLNELYKSIELANSAIKLNPENHKAWMNLGNRYVLKRDYINAEDCYKNALRINPNDAEIWFNMGNLENCRNNTDEAIINYSRALDLLKFNDTRILNFSKSARATKVQKIYLGALAKKADVHMLRGEYMAAKSIYEEILQEDSKFTFILGQYIMCKQKICDWEGREELLNKLSHSIQDGLQTAEPFITLGVLTSINLQPGASQLWGEKLFPPKNDLGQIKYIKKPKIRIGYFSADFYNHATVHLIEGLWRAHDKNKFEIYAFSFDTRINDHVYQKIQPYFDEFIVCDNMPDIEISKLARSKSIDIAIDLKGYTSGCRPNVFSYRAAPVQINYLGYPGTMGANYIDYIVADSILIPENLAKFYSEKIIYMPGSYQPNDNNRKSADSLLSRGDVGLPEDKFVYCCFNDSYKITPEIFNLWMQILKQADNSVLWLMKNNEFMVDNLRRWATEVGVDSSRVYFANKLPVEIHLQRQKLADLFLDTAPYNAHTTASDALWMGLPVLTVMGETFPSRVAASLLNSIGLNELICKNNSEYVSKALQFYADNEYREMIKCDLHNNKNTCLLFDTKKYTYDFERAMTEVLEIFETGNPPRSIYLH